MNQQRRQLNPQPVTEIPIQPRGRPPYMLELDNKLVKFLLAVRNRGGIINIHVVRASAKALIDTNPDQQQLARCLAHGCTHCICEWDYPDEWAPLHILQYPRGRYEECKKHYW